MTAKDDITWTENTFKYYFKGKSADTLTVQDINVAFRDAFAQQSASPAARSLWDLKRGPDGKIGDNGLAGILQGATEKMAGSDCGYLMTRAILADPIALVRGDRYYNADYTCKPLFGSTK